MQRREHPDTCEMRFNGVLYEVNLRGLRRALVHRQIEGLYARGQTELAAGAHTSRSSVNRVFRGRPVSLPTLSAIARALALEVNDVITAVGPNPDPIASTAGGILAADREPTSRSRDVL